MVSSKAIAKRILASVYPDVQDVLAVRANGTIIDGVFRGIPAKGQKAVIYTFQMTGSDQLSYQRANLGKRQDSECDCEACTDDRKKKSKASRKDAVLGDVLPLADYLTLVRTDNAVIADAVQDWQAKTTGQFQGIVQ